MNLSDILEREVGYISGLELPLSKKIKLYQMLYRSLTFDSQIYALLHGSCAISPKGNAILFGDGVDCLGKTSTSVALGKKSKKYVIDEFTLYNQATQSVYGCKKFPILYREGDNESAILPSEMGMEVVNVSKLSAIVSPHPIKEESYLVEETDPILKMRKIAICATAHRLKFCDNGLDRSNGERDVVEKIELADYTSGYRIPEGLNRLPYFDAYLNKPEDIIYLLERKGL